MADHDSTRRQRAMVDIGRPRRDRAPARSLTRNWRAGGPFRGPPCRSKDRAAVLLRLVGAVAAAEHGAGEATDQRARARGFSAVGDRTAGGAEAGADQAADRAGL